MEKEETIIATVRAVSKKRRGPLGLAITQKAYDMTEYGYICLQRFPKAEKHALALDIKLKMFRILELIIVASNSKDKTGPLDELNTQIDLLRLLIRLAYNVLDHTSFPARSYDRWSKILDEVGKMTGGWIKSLK